MTALGCGLFQQEVCEMKPIKFKEANKLWKGYVRTDGEVVKDLPTFAYEDMLLSCWKMSFKERLVALIFGRAWLCIRTKEKHPPVWIHCYRTGMEDE